MKAAEKHYKCINSKTGNAISYHTIKADVSEQKLKEELESVKNQVAVNNSLFADTLYWEEVKDAEGEK